MDVEDALMAKLSGAVAACRQLRGPLSLLLVEIDRAQDSPVPFHAHEAQQVSARLNALCRTADQPRAVCLLTSTTRCAVILPGCDRTQAVAAGNLLVRDAPRYLYFSTANPEDPVTVSVGVATVSLPARNFQPQILSDAAERCLDAAQLSGGNKLKSIGVY
jgi:GGDEF domain-containing protein